MRKSLVIFGILLSVQLIYSTNNIDSLLNVLDDMVANRALYTKIREEKISNLKELLKITTSNEQQFVVCGQLFDEYFYYQKDSALVYARKKLKIANELKDNSKIISARIKLASTNASIGMYKEASDILNNIDISKYPELKVDYFNQCAILSGYMGFYAVTDQDRRIYNQSNKLYYDSLLSILPKDTSLYVLAYAGRYFISNEYDNVFKLLNTYYPKCTDIHDKAKLAYNISYIYGKKNDKKQESIWLAISAINDIKSVTKEYVSLRLLAVKLYESGDIERAYNYMSCSLEDAMFCNARLRTIEISQMLPLISYTYQHQAKAKQKILFGSVLIISILLVFLLIAIWRVIRQMNKLANARKELSDANLQLNELNHELTDKNNTLTEANVIKEEYIAKYMDQCSLYIDKMDEYRKNLHKIATTARHEELIFKIKSKDFIDDVLLEFYQNFDKTFIQLFPHFVEELNELIISEERIHLKPGQILNLELRIYALIRLGINDSIKIAAFLRCSTNTIYNYRTRNRNNSLGERETFEEKIMKIGSITK